MRSVAAHSPLGTHQSAIHLQDDQAPQQAPQQEAPPPIRTSNPEPRKPSPERQRDSGTPGQQQFIKRAFAGLGLQKVGCAASTHDSKAKDTAVLQKAERAESAPDSKGVSQVVVQKAEPTASAHDSENRDASNLQNVQPAPSSHDSNERTLSLPQKPVPAAGNHDSKGKTALVRQNPQPTASSHESRDYNTQMQGVPRHMATQADTGSGTGSDRAASQQNKVPYVPVIPEVDARYKTVLCMYHKQGRCPRGDGCSFAHGLSQLRRKPGKQARA